MGHVTVEELSSQLSTEYLHELRDFKVALNQILPRVYSMGDWPGLLHEAHWTVGTSGTVALPARSASIVFATVDNEPRSIWAQWHDYRLVGRTSGAGALYGLVDDGIHPTSVPLNWNYHFMLEFRPLHDGETFTGNESFIVTGKSWDGEIVQETVAPANGDTVERMVNAALSEIHSISYKSITKDVEVTAQVVDVGLMVGLTTSGTITSVTGVTRGFSETIGSAATSVRTYDVKNDPVNSDINAKLFTIVSLTDSVITYSSGYASEIISGDYVAMPTQALDDNAIVVGTIDGSSAGHRGNLSYRIYRVAEATSSGGEVVNALVKRKHVPVVSDNDTVYLDNVYAIKHALLAMQAEDNADMERATTHWAFVQRALDDELRDYQKSARPRPQIKPFGPGGYSIPSIQ